MNDKIKPLSEEAEAALAAFRAMGESKQAYYKHLQMIEEKYKDGGNATEEEDHALGELLLAHDKEVTAFNSAMEKIEDPDDRMALIKCMQ